MSESRLRQAGYITLAAATFLVAFSAAAVQLKGRVVGVSDGDTLTVLIEQGTVKVRLAEVDAPEAAQPFGRRSKQALSDLCYGKQVELAARGKDRYGRTIGTVTCDGIDAGTQQVRRGMAWVFDRYAPRDSPLYKAQSEAQTARRGLWAQQDALSPWAWRRQ